MRRVFETVGEGAAGVIEGATRVWWKRRLEDGDGGIMDGLLK